MAGRVNLDRAERRRVKRLSRAELEDEFFRDFCALIAVLDELTNVWADRDEARSRQERSCLKQLDGNRALLHLQACFAPVGLSSGTSTNLITKSRQPRSEQHLITLE